MMGRPKPMKKGEVLVKEGEKSTSLYFVQTGAVSVCLVRDKKNMELYRAGVGQVVGGDHLSSTIPSPFQVVAATDGELLEVPIDLVKQQVEASHQLVKFLSKGLLEKQKIMGTELKKLKQEQDPAPCPAENVAKVFGVIFHTALVVGTRKDGKMTVAWPAFKRYAQRIFLESPVRLEQAMNILVKLKLAERQMVKSDVDPNAPEELGFFHILQLSAIEKFFDFYQNYHFKPGYANLLKYDEKCMQTAMALVKATEGEKVDAKGAVLMNYKDTLDKLKETLGPTFNPDAIDRLQQKGLFVKRESSAKGGNISFLKSEFEIMAQNWKFLKEIEKWNEVGYVDLAEPKASPTPGANGPTVNCPSCQAVVTPQQKFCGDCGHKLAIAA